MVAAQGFPGVDGGGRETFFITGNLKRDLSTTLQGTNISPKNGILKMIFLFPKWDMLIPWRVYYITKLGFGKSSPFTIGNHIGNEA